MLISLTAIYFTTSDCSLDILTAPEYSVDPLILFPLIHGPVESYYKQFPSKSAAKVLVPPHGSSLASRMDTFQC